MNKLARLFAAFVMVFSAFAVVSATTAPANAATVVKCVGDKVNLKHEQKLKLITHTATIWYNSCHDNHGKRWTKVKSATYRYNRLGGLIGQAKYACTPVGHFKGVNYRTYVKNPQTGYYKYRKVHIPCTSDAAAVKHVTLDLARCYMPRVWTNGKLQRILCNYKVTSEVQWLGPNDWSTVGRGKFPIRD